MGLRGYRVQRTGNPLYVSDRLRRPILRGRSMLRRGNTLYLSPRLRGPGVRGRTVLCAIGEPMHLRAGLLYSVLWRRLLFWRRELVHVSRGLHDVLRKRDLRKRRESLHLPVGLRCNILW